MATWDTSSTQSMWSDYEVSQWISWWGTSTWHPTEERIEKKANTATRDAFCTTSGKALMLGHKDKPDICPKKLFNWMF